MRLINADALIKVIRKQSALSLTKGMIEQFIKSQPTAYDVDKVVEQLETKILGKVCIGCGYLEDNVCTYKGANCGVSKPMYEDIKKVFEEVKAGGVNE